METSEWIRCPSCGGKTRVRIRADTVLVNFPLFCPKCRTEYLIDAGDGKVSAVKKPDAKTQR